MPASSPQNEEVTDGEVDIIGAGCDHNVGLVNADLECQVSTVWIVENEPIQAIEVHGVIILNIKIGFMSSLSLGYETLIDVVPQTGKFEIIIDD